MTRATAVSTGVAQHVPWAGEADLAVAMVDV